MKSNYIKKVILTFWFICIGVFATHVSAQTFSYTLTYDNGGTGTITFNTLTLNNDGGRTSIPSFVTAINLSLGGSTVSIGSPIIGMALTPLGGASSATFTTSGDQIALLDDLNFFSAGLCPDGFTQFTLDCSGTSFRLQSIFFVPSGPSVANTDQSLVNSSAILQGTFTLQNTVMVNSFTYDCPVFDKSGICASAGGRNTATAVHARGINNNSGLIIASYRLDKNNSRIGAYADQNLSVSGPGAVQLGNNFRMMGLFGVWSERPDGIGAEVKVSAAYGQKSTTVNRGVVGTGADASEAGSGGSNLTSQGAQAVVKYGFGVMQDVVVSPYAGIRYTQNNMGSYTEATSSAVTAPLAYEALNTNATTALAGAEAKYRSTPKTTLFASAGLETDTNTSNGSYNASNASIGTLTPVNFNPNPVTTRRTASVGSYYDIEKNQRLGVTGIYRQEPFQAVSTTTVMATYTVGF
jgi:hypothetical protein